MTKREPFMLSAGEGEAVWALGGLFTVKLADEEPGGPFSLVEVVATRDTEPPLHIHVREDEAFYIIDGQMTFQVAGQPFAAKSGSFVFAPRGLAHAFTIDAEPTRMLLFASPGGFEHFALELGTPAEGSVAPAGWRYRGLRCWDRWPSVTGSRFSVHRYASVRSLQHGQPGSLRSGGWGGPRFCQTPPVASVGWMEMGLRATRSGG